MPTTALKAIEPDMPNRQDAGSIMESVIAKGDLSQLKPEERARYYLELCRSLGINELTQPFQYITLNGKLTLYATRTATDQLRAANGVSLKIVERRTEHELYIVVAQAQIGSRLDESTGAVSIKGLQGDALANAYMKAETKAKRRVTLSICGLGWMDESETVTVPTARPVDVNTETGEIIEAEPPPAAELVVPTESDTERAKANRRFHKACADAGLTPEATRLYAHAAGKVSSRRDLTIEQLNSLAGYVEQQLQRLTDGSLNPLVGVTNQVASAESDEALNELRQTMIDGDMLKPWLVEMGKQRRAELQDR